MRTELDKKELIIITITLVFLASLVLIDHLSEPLIVISTILLIIIVIIFGIILYFYRKKREQLKGTEHIDSE